MISDPKLQICKKTREIAAKTLEEVLMEVLESDVEISEAQFRDLWLKKLRTHSEIFPDGWYIPPPNGICVLFGTEDKLPYRVNYESLRHEDLWPKDILKLDKKTGIAYLFASPVNRDLGIIGDFGVTIYFGENPKIKSHIQKTLEITKKIFYFAKVGMKFSEVAKYCEKLCQENNLKNMVTSTTDPVGANIGHTIPGTDLDWSEDEKEVFKTGDWEKISSLISKKRIFINEESEQVLKEGMAITIEPRLIDPNDPTIPMASFHTIGLFEKNKKELLTNFSEILQSLEMSHLE